MLCIPPVLCLQKLRISASSDRASGDRVEGNFTYCRAKRRQRQSDFFRAICRERKIAKAAGGRGLPAAPEILAFRRSCPDVSNFIFKEDWN